MAAPKRKAPRVVKRRAPIPSSLSDFLSEKRGAGEENFLGTVRTHIVEKNKADNSRRQDIIHPSEMVKTDWCPKATFLRITTGVHHKQSFGFQSLNIFDTGHESHRKWQRRAWDVGWLEGMFECLHCYDKWWDISPKQCTYCKSTALEYAEVPLSAEGTHLIVGHSDGMLTPARSLLEIKTVGEGTVRFEEPERLSKYLVALPDGSKMVDLPAMWGSIKVPFPSHIRQGQIYLWLAQARGLDVDRMTYVYESKFNQDVKQFVVRFNPDIIAPLLETARDIKERVAAGDPAPDCVSGDVCKQCKPYQQETETDGEEAPRRGRRQALGENDAEARPAGTEAEKPSRGRHAGPAGQPDRTHRRQADGALRRADQVGRVRRNTASGSSSRREGL
ncbi:hypothetical protein [Streptomyces sp. CB03238]|uniref:hypothetical protein n=1 Tax=Streptomyces sp. CB03238 TaxID=1907777 RepID=UPI001180434D|nr:hypothetical protein [Streptomyces sp. CB03238]